MAGRLIDPLDRETYAALVSYVNSLPPGDELIRLLEMLGLLSAVGQRIPDALGEFLQELRDQTKAVATYHGQVDTRLAALPQEIASGIDPAEIAKAMSESFRQQLRQTGLLDTAQLLKVATDTMNGLSADLTTSLKPAAAEYRGLTATIAGEVKKLDAAATVMEQHNARLITREKSNWWMFLAAAVFAAFLAGGVAGILLEKRQMASFMSNIDSRIDALQTLDRPILALPKRDRKSGGL
jgi:hypothetical protein